MNVLFLTLLDFQSYKEHNIYCDLIREFIRNGHVVYCISPVERRVGHETHLLENGYLLKLKIGNTQKTNPIEKGLSTLFLELQFVSAIKRFFSDIHFDLVLYSTPPITLKKAVAYVKNRDGAVTYLLLKDIFPQNAVDLGMMSKKGWKSIIYRYFRTKEKRLYALSDYIGCMSQANVDYIIRQNPSINPEIVEVCPNSIEARNLRLTQPEREAMREKYGIPLDRTVFVYGGNLGKPQGIPFVIECLKSQLNNQDAFFLVVGDGTEFTKLETFFGETRPQNMKLMKRLPKDDYDRMIAACDVGLIFLDHRFTIPNFPSRLLAYMQAGLPVLACTDPNTDIGQTIVEGGFGWWCESNDVMDFMRKVDVICSSDLKPMTDQAVFCLTQEFSSRVSYNKIMEHFK